jgi:hypothetical protein
MDTSFAVTFLSCGGIFLLAFVAIGAFWFGDRSIRSMPFEDESAADYTAAIFTGYLVVSQ